MHMSKSIYEAALGPYEPSHATVPPLLAAYANLMNATPDQIMPDYLEQLDTLANPPDSMDIERAERFFSLSELTEIVEDKRIKNDHPLVEWPTYKKLLDDYGTRTPHSRALLLGAVCHLSSRGFVALAREEYDADEAHIVDLGSGETKAREGIFTYGCALQLPYASDTMDYVQTNQLFHKLDFDPSQDSYDSAIKKVIAGAHRVLRSGGQLLLKECLQKQSTMLPFEDTLQLTRGLKLYLEEAVTGVGFTDVHTIAPRVPRGVDYLHDSSRDFDSHATVPSFGTVALYARKP